MRKTAYSYGNIPENPIKSSTLELDKYDGPPFFISEPFTDEDRRFLKGIASLLPGISALLGKHCEIVLNSLEDPAHSVTASHNANISQRFVGTPISEHGLDVIRSILDKKQAFQCGFPRGLKGERVKSAIIPVLNADGRCLGALTLGLNLEVSLADFMQENYPQVSFEQNSTTVFGSSPAGIIDGLVTSLENEARFKKNLKQRDRVKYIVGKLEQQGIFQLREAVAEVSRRLGVSSGTVYMHLRALRGQTNEKDE